MLNRAETVYGIAGCQLRQWGSFALLSADGERDLTPRSRKSRAMVAYLVSHPGTKIPRERLSELLWGDREEAHARASLRQSLLEIRQATETPFLEADREHVWIPADRILEAAEDDGSADAPPFDDLNHVTDEFDAWLTVERARRTAAILGRHRQEAERLLAEGRGPEAIPVIDRMARIDPYDESILCLAMRADFQANRSSALQQRFKETEARNRSEFGVGLAVETRALRDRLLQELCAEPAAAEEPAAEPAPEPPREARAAEPSRGLVASSLLLAASIIGGQYWIGVASAETKPTTVAVLPFRALGAVDPYLIDGFSEELLSGLAGNPDLRVTGRGSAWAYKGKTDNARRIGRDLRVRYLVQGAVMGQGSSAVVTASLVDTRDGRTVWTQRMAAPRALDQSLQDRMRAGVLAALEIGTARAQPHRQAQGEAYQLYLRSKGLFRDREKSHMVAAEELLRQAVRIDPDFADAWALLGGVQSFSGAMSAIGNAEARRSTERALRLDPESAQAHAMRALVLGFDTDAGRAHIARAAKLNPHDPQIAYWLGNAASMALDFRGTRAAVGRALAIDPLWHRPVEAGINAAVEEGDLGAARQMMERVRQGDAQTAAVAEAALANALGDMSRLVALAANRPKNAPTSMAYEACMAWVMLSAPERCGNLGMPLPVQASRIITGKSLTQADLQSAPEWGNEGMSLELTIQSLLREKRYADLIALASRPGTMLHGLDRIAPGNRYSRLAYAGRIALALEKSGRGAEAKPFWRAANEAGAFVLRNGIVPSAERLAIAANEAAQGRREPALRILAQAKPTSWTFLSSPSGDLGADPMLAGIRDDPRFEALRRKQREWRERERREALAAVG